MIALEDTETTFSVQKALLCHVSDYFVKALNSGFKESTTQTLKLPGCDVETFRHFLYWLSTRELYRLDYSKLDRYGRFDDINHLQLTLVHLWVFADRFAILQLQDAVMRGLFEAVCDQTIALPSAIQEAYNTTSSGSPLRRLFLKSFLAQLFNGPSGGMSWQSSAWVILESSPGFLQDCFEMISKSRCKSINCECYPSCYKVQPDEHIDFLVIDE